MTARFLFVSARTVLAGMALLALGWGLPAGSTGPARTRAPGDRRPNLVLITVDSLRPDHLGTYGYARPTSPNIDALAAEAVVVSDGIAQAPYTKASIASLLTGLFPASHKTYTTSVPLNVLQQSGSAGSFSRKYTDVLSADLPTLPGSLRAAGYHTTALTANPYLIPDFGFASGFVEFKYVKGASAAYAHADQMMAEAADLIAHAPEPFFLWVHLMDAHNPYEPPEACKSLLPPLTPPRPIDRARIPDWLRINDSNDLNLYLARYDAGIRAADAAVGDFFALLRARNLWDRTGIVLTADHGEGFMEHDLMSHNNSLYDELLRVPLIVKLPGVPARRVRAQVQLVDLVPTLARVAGATPPGTLHGQDVLPVLKGVGTGEPYAYAELVGQRFALRTLDWKFISSLQGGRQLFDLRQDPRETNNLARTEVAAAERFERLLARALAMAIHDGKDVEQHPVPVPPAVVERLRALGYVTK